MSQMIEVKVAEAIGPALDWLVGTTEGLSLQVMRGEYGTGPRVFIILEYGIFRYRPSTEWAQAGPLIEKYGCDLNCISAANCWEANCWDSVLPDPDLHLCEAETPLIAVCRAIVTAKLGDKVMVPSELIQ